MPTNWTNRTKPEFHLLTEDGNKLTQENGFYIVLDFLTEWVERAKTIITNWTTRIKP